jgi:hypothetical protein
MVRRPTAADSGNFCWNDGIAVAQSTNREG